MRILDDLLDVAALSRTFSSLVRYAFNRIEGYQYECYRIEDEVALALDLVKDLEGCVIDAGANQGHWSRLFLSAKPSFNRLIIVEPLTIHGNSLRELGLHDDRVVVEQVALGSSTGAVPIYADAPGSSLSSLYPRNLSHIGKEMAIREVVPITTLDAIAQRYGIDRIAFLKLDLEGNEFEALKGAKGLLDRSAISALCFEFGGCNIDSRVFFRDFWLLLKQGYGFTLYRILPKRRLRRLSSYNESLEQFSWQNILACGPNVVPNWRILD